MNSASIAFALAIAASSPGARAANRSATVNATVQVDNSCRMTLTPLSFGTATVVSGQMDAQTTIALACGPATAYSVAIDNGQYFNGQRRMYGGSAFGFGWYVPYQLYRDAARSQVWGSTPGSTVNGITPANGKAVLAVYGRVPNSIVLARPYIDTVTVTVTF